MKPPKPTEGVARHCWGKRRRIAKKTEKGLWKAMDRLGLLQKAGESMESCSWESRLSWFRRNGLPYIARWEGPSYGRDDWSESPVANIGANHVEDCWDRVPHDWEPGDPLPSPRVRSDRHALQLLRQEIRDRKRRALQGGKDGEA